MRATSRQAANRHGRCTGDGVASLCHHSSMPAQHVKGRHRCSISAGAHLHQLIGDDLSKVTIPFVVPLADIGYLRSILLGLQAFGCAHLLSFAALVHSCDPGYLKIYLKMHLKIHNSSKKGTKPTTAHKPMAAFSALPSPCDTLRTLQDCKNLV